MTLSEASRIDIVAESPDGRIVLAIVAPGWDDVTARRDELVRKLGTYIDYMHSPEYTERFGAKEPVVYLITQADPPPEIVELLHATEAAAGIPIRIQRLSTMGGLGATVRPYEPLQFEEPPVADTPGPGGLPGRAAVGPPPAGYRGPSLEEILAAMRDEPAQPDPVPQRIRTVRQLFGLIGLIAGVAAGVYAWSRSGSIALGLFVFVMGNHLVSRGAADVVTDPQKVRRVFYFLLPTALSTALLVIVWRQWEIMWLAVVVGFFGGLMLNAFLAPRLFPRISREEQADSAQRMKEAFGKRRAAGRGGGG